MLYRSTSGTIELEFGRPPSALAFMARAFYPSPRRRGPVLFPDLRVRWRGHRIDRRHLSTFRELTGLREEPGLPLLYPHVLGFRLHMVVLTHPSFPVPIWRALQIRNHLLRHRHVPEDALLDLETRVSAQRTLDKGAEVDLYTTVASGGVLVWESVVTFYYRGRFGEPGVASSLARPLGVPDGGPAEVTARWRMPAGNGWAFGGLTGDYNGIHSWDAYARRFGFRRAFHHPQLVLGQCLARLQPGAVGAEQARQRLDAQLKGPVYHDGEVRLRAGAEGAATRFALFVEGEDRPAIVGRLGAGEAAAALGVEGHTSTQETREEVA